MLKPTHFIYDTGQAFGAKPLSPVILVDTHFHTPEVSLRVKVMDEPLTCDGALSILQAIVVLVIVISQFVVEVSLKLVILLVGSSPWFLSISNCILPPRDFD